MHTAYPYLGVTALILATYYKTLSYGLVIDDIDYFRAYRQNGQYWTLWMRFLYGSSPSLSILTNHIITLTLHIITCLLLCHISPVAALLFAIHPCNHQTAVWLNGRRYSVLNILFLVILITHTWWILPPLLLIVSKFAWAQLSTRMRCNVPRGIFTPLSIINAIRLSMWRLSGLPRYSFRYPYHNTASFLPYTQPVAERYLSIPLILTCILIAKIPPIIILLYLFRTRQLLPMYADIQSFYDYHHFLYPNLEKLTLFKQLYPEIKT